MTKDEKYILDVNKDVITTFKKVHKDIISCASKYPEYERWLVVARIVNCLATVTYNPVFKINSEKLKDPK